MVVGRVLVRRGHDGRLAEEKKIRSGVLPCLSTHLPILMHLHRPHIASRIYAHLRTSLNIYSLSDRMAK